MDSKASISSSETLPTGKVIKTFNLRASSALNSKHFTIYDDSGEPVLFTECTTGWISDLLLTLHVTSPVGPIVACSKISYFGMNVYIALGDVLSGPVGRDPWQKLDRRGTISGCYAFSHKGKTYAWKRTHNKAHGGSMLRTKDYKLVDVDDPDSRVLAVSTSGPCWGALHREGKIEWFAELDEDSEKLALVAVFATVERTRRNEGTTV